MNALFFLGEAHHNRGNWADAQRAFDRAAAAEQKYARVYGDDSIYTVRVFQYANFLLDRGDFAAVEQRVGRATAECEKQPDGHRLDIAYNRYLLGRVETLRGLARTAPADAPEFAAARDHLGAFMRACWEQAMTDGRVTAHLGLAELADATGDADRCRRQLAGATELCEPDDIRRFRCECDLGYARFHLWQNDPATPGCTSTGRRRRSRR